VVKVKPMARFVTRFAPSPTGRLHLGHAYSAIVNFEAAKAAGGSFILRIEDIDATRCKSKFEDAIYEDLKWLGLQWEEPVRRQSDHFADYEAALMQLIRRRLVYRCFKTRKEILDEIARAPHHAAEGPDGPGYVGEALSTARERALLEEGAPFAWRLSLARVEEELGSSRDDLSFRLQTDAGVQRIKATPEIFGDVVIGRKDNGASYHLASVHDDALQGVTHVIRGEDLAAAAHLHCLLQMLLGLPPVIYEHHRLITDESGRRLAKRDQSVTLQALREEGVSPEEIRRRVGLPGA
jgi:glutamyl-Q tRNA(Asp) synthetase